MWVPYKFRGFHVNFNQLKKMCLKMCVKICVADIPHGFNTLVVLGLWSRQLSGLDGI